VYRDVKERAGLGVPQIRPVPGTTLKRLVVHRDAKERAGLGVPQSRPDLGRSLNCHVIEAANRCLTVGNRADEETEVRAQKAGENNVATAWTMSRDGFLLQPRGRPFAIEVFSGSSRLCRHLRMRGFDAWAVDWKNSRLTPETPAQFMLNLAIEADQRVLLRMFSHPSLAFVHFGPHAIQAQELGRSHLH